MSENSINYTKEAFFHPINLGLLFGATLTSFFLNDAGLISSTILTLSFGMELVYLGTVPNLTNFKNMIKMKKVKEREPVLENKHVFNSLDDLAKKRFLILKHLTLKIKDNFEKQSFTTQGLLQNIERKIDGLISNYINLLELNKRYKTFINAASLETIRREIQEEEQELEQIDSERLKERKRRRLLILNKRLERYDSAKERFDICSTELETIEDAIRYIYEQSMTMNNPEEIGFQLDNLLMEVEETSSIIEELDGGRLDDFGILDSENLDFNVASDSIQNKPQQITNS